MVESSFTDYLSVSCHVRYSLHLHSSIARYDAVVDNRLLASVQRVKSIAATELIGRRKEMDIPL